MTGRLDDEWIKGARRFTLWAWIALAVGNVLGMLWSYEELGWGGYWAWDPVENAAFMPLLAGTPFLHSVMLQERRGMFKVWNVFLLCTTFLMTIFGTFLTRSGMIASVHSFAKSSIGNYFVVFIVLAALGCIALIVWRLPLLRAEHRIDSLLSRDFVFLLNNWILLSMLLFVLVATTWPLISEAVRGQTVTVGPGFYNKWMIPLGLVLMSLTGVGPLLAWRKSTGAYLARVLLVPSAAALTMAVLHLTVGPKIGFPAFVQGDDIYDTMTGKVLAAIYGAAPLMATTICTFVVAGHFQEFWRGTALRMRNTRENAIVAFFEVITRAKRRHGGYIVHLGLVMMYFGFTGAAYDKDKETALHPGQSFEVSGVQIRYDRSRMEVDPNKRMIFTDMTVMKNGKEIAQISPAKFIYEKPAGTATTEVAIRSSLGQDVYAIMNSVNPETKVGTFRVIVRPFVAWIWLGCMMMMLGAAVSISPSVREVLGESRERARMPAGAAAALTGIVLVVLTGAVAFALLATEARARPERLEFVARRFRHDGQCDGAPAVLAAVVRVRGLSALAAVDLRVLGGRGHAGADPQRDRCWQDAAASPERIPRSLRPAGDRDSGGPRHGSRAVGDPGRGDFTDGAAVVPLGPALEQRQSLCSEREPGKHERAGWHGRARRWLRGSARRRAQALG